MQVVRNLAELPWKPQLALALPDLTWQDAGNDCFSVTATRAGREISVRFELNEQDEIIRADALRHYDVPDGFVEVPWRYAFSDYRDFNGIRMPSRAVATYEKAEGPWEYWRGSITSSNLV